MANLFLVQPAEFGNSSIVCDASTGDTYQVRGMNLPVEMIKDRDIIFLRTPEGIPDLEENLNQLSELKRANVMAAIKRLEL